MPPVAVGCAPAPSHLAARFPLIVTAVAQLSVRTCLIDGEAVCCDENSVPVFNKLRGRRDDHRVFLSAFDLLELDGADLRPLPIEDPRCSSPSCCAEHDRACSSTSTSPGPPRLQARPRGHRQQAPGLALSLRPIGRLAQDEKSPGLRGETRGRGGLGPTAGALAIMRRQIGEKPMSSGRAT